MRSTPFFSRAIKSTLFIPFSAFSQSIVAAPCPETFYSLPLPEKASTCHQFNDTLPASLSFHSKHSMEEVKQFYQGTNLVFQSSQKHLGRYVIKGEDDQYRIVISKDGNGAQVDLLVMK